MPRYRLTIAYDGTDFHGWQRQEPPGEAPLRTVQGALEEAVAVVVGSRVPVLGASRTDAGVHAAGQVAAFTADTSVPADRMALAINARLPRDVRVLEASPADPAFDPISDCTSKCYRYTIVHADRGLTAASVFDRRTTWSTWHALDAPAMQAAAGALVGTHDFAAFAQVNHGRESTVRTVFGCTVSAPADRRLVVEIAGSGFLYNMVRIVAGTLVEAGRGKVTPEDIRRALATGDRTATGPTLPPHGLRLEWVRYGARA